MTAFELNEFKLNFICEFISWTQNAYALLYKLGHKGALFALKSEHKLTKKTRPSVEADTEDFTHFASRVSFPKWHYADAEEMLCCLIVE